MIDDDNDRKIRIKQSKLIASTQSSYSFSKVINDVLRKKL